MSAKIPAFSAIGQNAKEVLTGSKQGVYQYNRKLTYTSKTTEGVDFVSTLTQTGPNAPADVSLKAIYKTGDTSISALAQQNGKIVGTLTQSNLTPGLSLTLNGTYPEGNSGKLGADYFLPHVTLKSTVGLTPNPTVEASITSGVPNLFGGAEVTYNTSSNTLSKWTLGAGYTHKEFQLGVLLLDKGDVVRATYTHSINSATDTQVAGEINHNIRKGDSTTIIIGGQTRLDNGALIKARLDSESILSLHWEALIHPKTTVGLSAQINASKFDAAPKLGFAASASA